MKKLLYIFVLLWLAGGCEKPADIDFPAHTPRLVLHGYVPTNTLVEVFVGRTVGFKEGNIPASATFVENAQVILFENNQPKDTLVYDAVAKKYISDASATAGNTYTLKVSANGFEPVEATAYALFPVANTEVKHVMNARLDNTGNWLNDVVFKFSDPGSTANYYLAHLSRENPGANGQLATFCVYAYDPAVERAGDNLDPFSSSGCIANDKVLYSDKTFNGSLKEITLSGDSWSLQAVTFNNKTYRPFIKNYNISQEFYNYVKAGLSLDALEDNPFAQLPVIRGNVKNGHGLFTVYGMVVDTLR